MTHSWATAPIEERHLPCRSQPVVLKTWNGAANWNNGYQQYHYLLKGSDPEIPPFTIGGEIITPDVAYGIGQKYGQRRIIVTPLNTYWTFLDQYACHIATKCGFDEHGWYAACHYTAHPHVHIIAETECSITGRRLDADDVMIKQWHLHAVKRSTQIEKLWKPKDARRCSIP